MSKNIIFSEHGNRVEFPLRNIDFLWTEYGIFINLEDEGTSLSFNEALEIAEELKKFALRGKEAEKNREKEENKVIYSNEYACRHYFESATLLGNDSLICEDCLIDKE